MSKIARVSALMAIFIGFNSLPRVSVAQDSSGSGFAVAEATIYGDNASANGGNWSDICIGNQGGTSTTRRGLIEYSLPEIPQGATVTRVSLDIRQSRVRKEGRKEATLEVFRVNSSWSEGSGADPEKNAACGGGSTPSGVNWNNQPDAQASPSATASLPSTDNFNVQMDTADGSLNSGLLADVQAWVDGEANNGWLFAVREETVADNARLMRPGGLTVEWTLDEEPTFQINAGLNDVWFDHATDVQGFSFVVFPEVELFFLTYFTFDTERPAAEVEADLGEPGHRWLTALGEWDGNIVTLNVELTSGGIFNDPEAEIVQEADYGSMVIEFTDCENATLDYDLPSIGESGTIELVRIVNDNVPLCEALAEPTE